MEEVKPLESLHWATHLDCVQSEVNKVNMCELLLTLVNKCMRL